MERLTQTVRISRAYDPLRGIAYQAAGFMRLEKIRQSTMSAYRDIFGDKQNKSV